MLKKCVYKMSITKVVLSAVVFTIMFTIINFSSIGVAGLSEIANGVSILDFQFGYSVETAFYTLEALGEAGRDFYLNHIILLDFPFPVVVMLFFFCLTAYILKRVSMNNSWMYVLLLIPIMGMLFDWLENISIFVMLIQYPNVSLIACTFGSCMTMLKFIFSYLKIITVGVTLVVMLMNKHNPSFKDQSGWKFE